MKIVAYLSYAVTALFVFMGFDKMTNYENPESAFEDSVNAYVGGDAYNYIINANFTTSFFTLALVFAVVGSAFLIVDKLAELIGENRSARLDSNSVLENSDAKEMS